MKLLTVLMLLLAVSYNLYAEKIIFAAEDQDQFPHYLGQSTKFDMTNPGLSVSMLQEVCKKLGLEPEFVRMPWKRCLKSMQTGKVDGIFNGSFKEERMEFGQYPMKNGKADPERRIATSAYVIYKHKNSDLAWDGKTFKVKGNRVGATLGYSVVGDLKKAGLEVDEGKDYQKNLLKVMKGRIPATVELSDATDFWINKNMDKVTDIIKHDPPFKVKPYYVLLSHQFVEKHPKLAEKIWDEIKILRDSPKYQELRKMYGL